MPQIHNPFQPSSHVFGQHAFGTTTTIVLAVVSAFSWVGVAEQLDITLSIIAKLVAIGAGLASIIVAYKTYKKANDTTKP